MSIVDVVQRYLDALISHDEASVSFAPDAFRTSNGKLAANGEAELRAILRREPVVAEHGHCWIVDGDQAIVFYDLEADMKRGEGPVVSPPEEWMPAAIGERFQVRDGRIEAIDLVFAANVPRLDRAPCRAEGPDRDTVLAAAKGYVASLVSHDASDVALADDAWRIENGQDTGSSGDAIRESLESDLMRMVQSISDERWFADGDSAAVFYTLIARVGDQDTPMRIAERFRVAGGKLVEIEAVVSAIATG